MNEAENLLRKSCHVLKLGQFFLKVASVSVRAQRAADPSLMKDSVNAIFRSSSLYMSLLTKRYNWALLNHPLAFAGSPSKVGGCPSFSSCGFCCVAIVDATVGVPGWLLMFFFLSSRCRCWCLYIKRVPLCYWRGRCLVDPAKGFKFAVTVFCS